MAPRKVSLFKDLFIFSIYSCSVQKLIGSIIWGYCPADLPHARGCAPGTLSILRGCAPQNLCTWGLRSQNPAVASHLDYEYSLVITHEPSQRPNVFLNIRRVDPKYPEHNNTSPKHSSHSIPRDIQVRTRSDYLR